MRIIFMGTPDFAVASLQKLHENNCQIVGVITAPDRPKGRGQKLQPSPVKAYAMANNLPVLQPTNLKNQAFLQDLAALEADLQVVVAFRMLPASVFNMPPLGTINLHGSLLPQYRGAAPIHWAVINGEKETGVTTFFIEQKIDTGELIFQTKIPIGSAETTGDLHDRMMHVGADLVLKTVEAIAANDYPSLPQQMDDVLKKAPKIFKEDCRINFNQSVEAVHNFVRGMNPFPAAFLEVENNRFKVFEIKKEKIEHNLPIGSYETDNKTFFKIACIDGFAYIQDWQMAGKKRQTIDVFLNGYTFKQEKDSIKMN